MNDAERDDADDRAHDARAEQDAADHFDELRRLAQFPQDDGSRHVLIVEPDGMQYVAPHLITTGHPYSSCVAVGDALRVFLTPLPGQPGRRREDAPAPGRYWISVGDDGNLEIGGRVPDDADVPA